MPKSYPDRSFRGSKCGISPWQGGLADEIGGYSEAVRRNVYASRGNCTDHLSACKLGAFLAYTGAPYDSDIYDPYYNETNVLLIYFAILVAIVLYGLVCLVRSHAKLSLATAVVYLFVYLFVVNADLKLIRFCNKRRFKIDTPPYHVCAVYTA